MIRDPLHPEQNEEWLLSNFLNVFAMTAPESGENQGEGSPSSLANEQTYITALKICSTILPTPPHTHIPTRHIPGQFPEAEAQGRKTALGDILTFLDNQWATY